MKIKHGDFVKLDFTAKTADHGVFDTTSVDDAKKANIHNPKIEYKPLVVKIGQGQLVKGLDAFIIDKEPGKYSVVVPAEQAFGKKDAKLLRLISLKEFHKNEIRPFPGLQVDLDGSMGVVRTVNGGRVIVDFNHPLSSHDISYDIEIKGVVSEPKEKVEAALGFFKIPFEKVETEGTKVIVTFKTKMPDEISKPVMDELSKLTDVKDIEFK